MEWVLVGGFGFVLGAIVGAVAIAVRLEWQFAQYGTSVHEALGRLHIERGIERAAAAAGHDIAIVEVRE